MMRLREPVALVVLSLVPALLGCDGHPAEATALFAELAARSSIAVERVFPLGSNHFEECMAASPLAIESQGKPYVLVAAGEVIAAIDPHTGKPAWQVTLASPKDDIALIAATPVVVSQKLVIAFQRTKQSNHARLSHHVAVIDLETRELDPAYPEIELHAVKPSADADAEIEFAPGNAISHAALVHADAADRELGFVYVSYGNVGDVRPWHGWVFELDLDMWRDAGESAAVSAVLLTTPETDCGGPGDTNSKVMRCGAGVWSPAGPKVYPSADGYELIIPTGNGVLDPNRGDYAHALMRSTRGLQFEPHCDTEACADFDPDEPSRECIESCEDLFVPRVMPGEAYLGPENGMCDGQSLLACYALLDWDLGANSPAKVELERGSAFVMPGKDGAVYLLDAEHMGTLYDRRSIVKPCGAAGDRCVHDWAGMMVTEPTIVELSGAQVALLPTFVFDTTHPAGVVALRIDESGATPRLNPLWQAPAVDDPLNKRLFREHPSRLALQALGEESYAWIVSVNREGHGALLAIRVRDGALAAGLDLHGRGQRYVKPLVQGARVYVPTCDTLHGPSELEGFKTGGDRNELASGDPR